MIICPVCRTNVKKLKSNSHIIPRFMMKSIKDGGRYVYVEQDRITLRKQTDAKANIVCATCENLFTKFDTFSALFFRDGKYLLEKQFRHGRGKDLVFRVYAEESRNSLWLFFLSLFIRGHLYCLATHQSGILGPYFGELCKLFVTEAVNFERFPFVMAYYKQFDNCHSMPEKARFQGRVCGHVIVYGILVHFFTDQRGAPQSMSAIKIRPNIYVPEFIDMDNKASKAFALKVSELKKRGREQ